MNREKIKLSTPEMATEFINICSKYECDINLYDGSNIIDAKSIVGVFGIEQGKVIEVQMISSNEDTIISFMNEIKKFEV